MLEDDFLLGFALCVLIEVTYFSEVLAASITGKLGSRTDACIALVMSVFEVKWISRCCLKVIV
jgi:hypothetical protein